MKYYIAILLLLNSCSVGGGDSFYKDSSEEDLYRIPLIKPYRLITLYGLKKDEGPTNAWQLDFINGGDSQYPEYKRSVNVTEVNVSKKIIYGHYLREGSYPDHWFVVNISKKFEKVFKGQGEWKTYLKQEDLDPAKLYDVWTLFDDFRKNGQLPWYDPSKAMYP